MAIKVQSNAFDAGEELDRFMTCHDGVGAVVNFVGIVRSNSDDEPVDKLVIEHYPGMTEASLQRIVDEAEKRWSLKNCLVIHRYGELSPGEAIMMVAVQTAHRQAAFEAANFLMDYLKSRAAFWKKEYRAGASEWVKSRHEDDVAAQKWQDENR